MLGIDFDLNLDNFVFFLEANVTPALGYQTEWEKEQKEKIFISLAQMLRSGHAQEWERVE